VSVEEVKEKLKFYSGMDYSSFSSLWLIGFYPNLIENDSQASPNKGNKALPERTLFP
jgi:hypothetical protein